ncbi:Iron-sulfur cluster assembly accessory protein [Thiothrix eikelboomii]|uniref:Iron-sulfur cluster assembly accessory protein n=1 Tax=Thiothrix eikelboomii TaxID=92487 RepID=A0A1T4XI86_9GAMM|nr:iron-sulfur cluster assembly accessory protein [Thiothrix eikelboomii]SKA89196.1 Iron-sulfur cluster assembly accessory protein [Thiothrix eikelboomii]
MMTITPEAITQIQISAQQSQAQGLPLRIAAERKADGHFHYQMGFDDAQQVGDVLLELDEVSVIIDADSAPLLQGAWLDFVDIEGQMEFVFMNPNDPHYRPPQA